MEKGASWDRLTAPRLSTWSSDVTCVVFEHGGKHMRTVFIAYSAPRYPQISARKVERSEFSPVSVLWPLKNVLEYMPDVTHGKEPLGTWTKPCDAMAKRLLWMSATSF